MGGVIHAIQEGNLPLVAFHLHMFAIGNQRATEAFSVAVVMGELIVVWENFQLCNNPCIRSVQSSADVMSQCANA